MADKITSVQEVNKTRYAVSFASVESAQELIGILLEQGATVTYQAASYNKDSAEKSRKRAALLADAGARAAVQGGSPLDYLPENFAEEYGFGKWAAKWQVASSK